MNDFCRICGRPIFKSRLIGGGGPHGEHRCPPAWRCWSPDWDQTPLSAGLVRHTCAGWAAEEYVARVDGGCDSMMHVARGESEVVVFVMPEAKWLELRAGPQWRDFEDGLTPLDESVVILKVSGEMTPNYNSEEISHEEYADQGQ